MARAQKAPVNDTEDTNEKKKKACPVTRAEFVEHAKPIAVKIGDSTVSVSPKEFSTGSVGWYTNAKGTFIVNGVPVDCQVAVTITAIGSKELPSE